MRALIQRNGTAVAVLAAIIMIIMVGNWIKGAPNEPPTYPYGNPPR